MTVTLAGDETGDAIQLVFRKSGGGAQLAQVLFGEEAAIVVEAAREVAAHAVDRRRGVAVLLENLGQQPHPIRGRHAAADVDDVVRDRFLTGQHGREARMGGDVGRVAALEQHAAEEERVEKRIRLNDQRMTAVLNELKSSGASSVGVGGLVR